jgi:hypothetical protein
VKYIKKIYRYIKAKFQKFKYSLRRDKFLKKMLFTEAVKNFPSRNELHAYMHHYLLYLAPKQLRDHRSYFNQNMRGFGEGALHSMWWTIFQEFKPKLVLEIGVYRGQVITLWGLAAKLMNLQCEVHGISPFSSDGDQVSIYMKNIDYLQDTLNSNKYFNLVDPFFLKAYSTDEDAVKYIKSRKWDIIYIDGNHDYSVALADYLLCRDSLADGGLLVMDDSSLYTNFIAPAFSFAGHPGPSQVVNEFAMKELRFLGGVGHNNVFQKL